MSDNMKRKQFHLSSEDEQLLKHLADAKATSEAGIVREAIRDYANKNLKEENPLLEMAKKAEERSIATPGDLSVNHDRYLREIYENER